jgi:hypothetical protein
MWSMDIVVTHHAVLVEVEMEILGRYRHGIGEPLISRERAGSWDSKTPTMSF